MKSKDEILDKFYVPNMHWKFFNRKNVLAAMGKYAKEVAIDFVKWKDENEYANSAALGRTLTTEELYNYYANNIFPEK